MGRATVSKLEVQSWLSFPSLTQEMFSVNLVTIYTNNIYYYYDIHIQIEILFKWYFAITAGF